MKTAGGFSIFAALLAGACGAAITGSPSLVNPQPLAKTPSVAVATKSDADLLATVPSGTFGPYVGDRAEGVLAVWAPEIRGKRKWATLGLRATDQPHFDPKMVADAPAEIDLVAVRPLGGAGSTGFVVVSSSHEFSGSRIDLLPLGLRGELLGAPVALATGLGDVMWLDAVPTSNGALAFFAVRRDDRADLFAAPLSPVGAPRDTPARIVEGARAWQVAKTKEGAAVAVLSAGSARGSSGPLRVIYVDGAAHLEPNTTAITDGATVEADLDMAAVGERLAIVWSDRRGLDTRLYGAFVDGAGVVTTAPRPLGVPFGPQTVLRLIPTGADKKSGVALAWENLLERSRGSRRIRVAPLSIDGALGPGAILQMASADAVPEFAATEQGIAALTLAPACLRGEACDPDRIAPTFVEFNAAMNVVTSSPVRLDRNLADLVWGLTCKKDCIALAAGTDSPAPIYSVRPGKDKNAWLPAAFRDGDAALPRARSLEAIGRSSAVSELSSLRAASSTLVSWVTYLDPSTPFTRLNTKAPDGKFEAPRAILTVRALPGHGAASEPVVLSYRANSPGGVALAPGEDGSGDALVLWTGIDERKPEVFLTLVDAEGKKLKQKMITHAKTGVRDVAIAKVSDGWVIGWIDEHAGKAEVRVQKVDRSLRPTLPERRIGPASSSPSGLQISSEGDRIIAVWSDARGDASGIADIFAERLSTKDLSAIGPEHTIVETPEHSRSPAIAPFKGGTAVAWVEDPSPGSKSTGSSAVVARLDSGGELVPGSVVRIVFGGSPEGLALECGGELCRVSATVFTSDGGAVEGFTLRADQEPVPRRLVMLSAAPRDAIAPSMAGDQLIYSDEDAASQTVVRRLTVDWE